MESKHQLRVDMAQIATCETQLQTMEAELAALELVLGGNPDQQALSAAVAELHKIRESCMLTRGILADLMTYDKEAGSIEGMS